MKPTMTARLRRNAAQENEADEQNEKGETADDQADGEINDDASDTGPDANPNEPGHQDASDTEGSE